MKGRCLVALLALYAGLDFANPLMPGAVHFVDGVVTVVDGAREAPAKPPLALPSASSLERPVSSRGPTPAVKVSAGADQPRPWRVPVRRPHRAAEPPPLADDH